MHPDPRLNEAFLELLWRGLRRVAPGAALCSLASAHPALACLEERQDGHLPYAAVYACICDVLPP